MKLVYGISGFGNGHVVRSSAILKALLTRGHDVAVFGFDASKRYIENNLPDVPLFEIKVPVLHPHPDGLDFGKIADDPANHYADGIQMNYRAMQHALDYFGGKADFVLSDYELVAAEFAYATVTPLITIDQHSKFVGFKFPDIGTYSSIEDYSRLNLFFPQAEARYATSFFEVPYDPNLKFDVNVIPPILRDAILNLSDHTQANEVLVYISTFANIPQSVDEIYAILAHFEDYTFHVFVPDAQPNQGNVHFHTYDTDHFLERLSQAQAVISTAGHTLLSELAYLKKPVLVIPSATFDQHTCAIMVDKLRMGKNVPTLTHDNLQGFLDNIPVYQDALDRGEGMLRGDGVGELIRLLQRDFGL